MNGIIKRYITLPNTIKAAIWLTFSNILLKGISFFTAPLFARILSPDEYGKLTLFASYEQIILIFATWEIGLGPFQRGLFKYKEQKGIFQSAAILYSNIITAALMIVICIFSNQATQFTEMPFWLLITILVYAFTYTSYVSWMTENKVSFCYRSVSIMTVCMATFQIISSYFAVITIGATAEIKLLFSLVPAVCICTVFTLKRFRPRKLFENIAATKEQLAFLFKFSWPLLIHSLSYLVLGQSDRIMIGKMIGNSAAGLYGVAYTISSVVIIVQNAVLQVLSPWIYHCMDKQEYHKINKKASGLLVIVSVVYLVFMLFAPDVIIFLYPDFYWEGIWCIPPISMGVYFMFLYSMFVSVEEFLDQTKYVAIVSTFCSLLNILLNYFGIIQFGYIACAYTTLICYVLFAIGHYLFMRKVQREKGIIEPIYNGKVLLFISTVMLAFMILFTLIYDKRLIRYAIAFAIFALILCFWKKIISTLVDLIDKNDGGNDDD